MNRVAMFALGTVLLFCSTTHSASMGDTVAAVVDARAGGAEPDARDPNLQDFNHALAVQATPDQTSQFRDGKEHGSGEEAGAGTGCSWRARPTARRIFLSKLRH